MKDLALVSKEDLSLVDDNSLNELQLQHILKSTPSKYIKKRPAKGGGEWRYVTGGYVKKCLNLMFGWDWDFEIISEEIKYKQIVVKGRLTCRTNGRSIVKMQFGSKDIAYKKNSEEPLDIGNDFKAAATDCLKKCASEIGIAADIYNAEDFREVKIKPSFDEVSKDKESKRIFDHIANSSTLEELNQVGEYITTDEQIKAFKSKENELNK